MISLREETKMMQEAYIKEMTVSYNLSPQDRFSTDGFQNNNESEMNV